PPEFNAQAGVGLANAFTACIDPAGAMNALGSMLTSGATCNFAGAFTIDTPCNGPEGTIDASSLTCDLFMSPDGRLNQTQFEGVQRQINDTSCQLNCKKAKSAAINTELNCLTNQAKVLSNQVQSLQQNYQQNIQRMQQDIQNLTQIEADRDQQAQDV